MRTAAINFFWFTCGVLIGGGISMWIITASLREYYHIYLVTEVYLANSTLAVGLIFILLGLFLQER